MKRTVTLEVSSDAQERVIRQFHAFLAEMESLAEQAPDGHVLDVLESAAVDGGRKITLATLESAAQQRIDFLEKKARPSGPANAVGPGKVAGSPRGRSRRRSV